MHYRNMLEIIELMNFENIQLTNRSNSFSRVFKCLMNKVFDGCFVERLRRKIYSRTIKNHGLTDNWTYEEWQSLLREGNKLLKVVVYTCITGNYDVPKKPLYYPENVDYILFTTEFENDVKVQGWDAKPIPEHIKEYGTDVIINRYVKFHPHELFMDKYDIAIYVDGNITVVSDLVVLVELMNKDIGLAIHKHYCRSCIYEEVKACIALKKGNKNNLNKQVALYRLQGFPQNYGLLECNVLITDLKSEKAKSIYGQWWNEFLRSGSGRDQIALPFVLWRNGIKVSEVATLGRNVYRNPKIRVSSHNVTNDRTCLL